MKYSLMVFLLLFGACASSNHRPPSGDIRLNQLGFYPEAVKTFVVVGTEADVFDLRDGRGETVYTGDLVDRGKWDKSNESVKTGKFSDFNRRGQYTVHVKDKGASHPFEIKDNLYHDAHTAAMKSYYFHRASLDLEERYAGIWNREAGHPDTIVYFHPSSGRSEGSTRSPGGWYDAGDYNKYVVNGGITVGTILSFHELIPEALGDGSLNIPESGNGLHDLLDEVKYELDWILTMQDDDGGVFVKVTAENFESFVPPHEATSKRWVVGKSTGATLNLVGVAAQAARIYRLYDADFAGVCLKAARRGWNWAVKNDMAAYTENPEGIATGVYGDDEFSDEFLWAAAELFVSTGEEEYLEYIEKNYKDPRIEANDTWKKMNSNLGYFSLVTQAETIPVDLREEIIGSFVSIADSLLDVMESVPYRIPLERFYWGSNSDVLNHAMILAFAFTFTRDSKYIQAAVEAVDYIFGKNATGYSFVTGYGDKSPMNIHHRPSATDGIDEPIPGYLVNGSNEFRHDDIEKHTWGVEYPNTEPAKCYIDLQGSYATNEVAINWNGALVFMLGFLEAHQDAL